MNSNDPIDAITPHADPVATVNRTSTLSKLTKRKLIGEQRTGGTGKLNKRTDLRQRKLKIASSAVGSGAASFIK